MKNIEIPIPPEAYDEFGNEYQPQEIATLFEIFRQEGTILKKSNSQLSRFIGHLGNYVYPDRLTGFNQQDYLVGAWAAHAVYWMLIVERAEIPHQPVGLDIINTYAGDVKEAFENDNLKGHLISSFSVIKTIAPGFLEAVFGDMSGTPLFTKLGVADVLVPIIWQLQK
jgi:hypothetical protein